MSVPVVHANMVQFAATSSTGTNVLVLSDTEASTVKRKSMNVLVTHASMVENVLT
jgi:hypothetical protein